jgi:hypothetical protein
MRSVKVTKVILYSKEKKSIRNKEMARQLKSTMK